jgi:hypothetical protein
MPRKKRPTLSGMVIAGGWRNARVALRYASRYGLAAEALGHAPSIKEYQSFNGLSQAQAYKDWKAWKACVGDVSVLDAVSDDALRLRGLSEEDREEAVARWFADG